MDEASFLTAIADCPFDEEPVRAFARWLTAHGDKRGDYLQLELDRRDAEAKLVELDRRLQDRLLLGEINVAWLDQVLPLYIVSPAVGRFYAAPTPDSDPYVKVGDFCNPSTVVGIIETMRVFVEILAGMTGVISDVFVATGDPVD